MKAKFSYCGVLSKKGHLFQVAWEPVLQPHRYPDTNFFAVGASIVSGFSDRTAIKWRKERGGVWYPEDRLRAFLFSLAVLVLLSLAL